MEPHGSNQDPQNGKMAPKSLPCINCCISEHTIYILLRSFRTNFNLSPMCQWDGGHQDLYPLHFIPSLSWNTIHSCGF